jgi:hypothetical protein
MFCACATVAIPRITAKKKVVLLMMFISLGFDPTLRSFVAGVGLIALRAFCLFETAQGFYIILNY